jgi:hypothetical protein
MLASLVFLTPRGFLLAVVVIVPLAALAVALRRERWARRVLGLREPGGSGGLLRALALVGLVVLLALIAAQPALRSTTSLRERTDAQAMFVLDVSRSMLAASGPHGQTRLQRARADAIRLRDELADIPAGVASMTDRVLPNLFPGSPPSVFAQTVREAVQVDSPPPQSQAVTATSLDSLAALGTGNYFSPDARHRLAVVLTDGETQPYDLGPTARALSRAGVTPLFVHVWSPGEQIYQANGTPEDGYHEDPGSRQALETLAQATGGAVVGEQSLGAAAAAARRALGSGPSVEHGVVKRQRPLGPWLALAALVLLAVVFVAPLLRRPSLRAEPIHGR